MVTCVGVAKDLIHSFTESRVYFVVPLVRLGNIVPSSVPEVLYITGHYLLVVRGCNKNIVLLDVKWFQCGLLEMYWASHFPGGAG